MTPFRGYYAILDLRGGDAGGEALEARARALLAAGPCCLQLRAKTLGAGALREAAGRLAPLCRAAGVPFCVNDRADVALAVDADVVHVGQDDLPVAAVRRLVDRAGRRTRLVGVSTHSPAQARLAVEGGADYLGFGPIFATASKANPDPVVGLEALARVAREVTVPVVAIGGIDLGHVPLVAAAGAAAAAVIGAIDGAHDPTAAGKSVAAAFAACRAA